MRINPLNNDTIIALSTAQGIGAIAVIRISGKDALKICNTIFKKRKSKISDLTTLSSHTAHFGDLIHNDVTIDEVVLTLFKAPNSYTGEDVVEISCHGSPYIQQQILQVLVKQGARLANAGEFTLRAFLNGKFDLSQAEAVADLIASHSASSHQLAIRQMRGGFSNKIKILRDNLINFASLIELELDFSEEDVEFAGKDEFLKLVSSIQKVIQALIQSFELGNVIKNGIPVCIVGRPNSGKSTLLNTLLEEDRAIVSEIPGTTRDTIEDEIVLDGIRFRFIDTAGIHHSTDTIEVAGIERTYKAIHKASIVIYLFDVNEMSAKELNKELENIEKYLDKANLIIAGNKIDKDNINHIEQKFRDIYNPIFISAKEKKHIEQLTFRLLDIHNRKISTAAETILTNARHVEALQETQQALQKVTEGLHKKISGELLASDVRDALHYLGLITGQVSSEDLLHNIFSRFCIGK